MLVKEANVEREPTWRGRWIGCDVVDGETLGIPGTICPHSNSDNISCACWYTTMNVAAILTNDTVSIQYFHEVRGAGLLELQLEIYHTKPNNLKWFAPQQT